MELFINQEPIKDSFILSLSAGQVSIEDNRFIVAFEQYGAKETFSIGQPIYDIKNNLMGYLGIGLWDSLDIGVKGKDFHGENIPSYYWAIYKSTKYCEKGKLVYTYWQRWKTE